MGHMGQRGAARGSCGAGGQQNPAPPTALSTKSPSPSPWSLGFSPSSSSGRKLTSAAECWKTRACRTSPTSNARCSSVMHRPCATFLRLCRASLPSLPPARRVFAAIINLSAAFGPSFRNHAPGSPRHSLAGRLPALPSAGWWLKLMRCCLLPLPLPQLRGQAGRLVLTGEAVHGAPFIAKRERKRGGCGCRRACGTCGRRERPGLRALARPSPPPAHLAQSQPQRL